MSLISISDVIHDQNGSFPTSGTLTFILSEFFIASDGHIVIPKAETAATSDVDGTFTIDLESTTDGVPNNRTYSVSFSGVIEGVSVSAQLGTFQLPSSPSSQDLSDLLAAGITAVSTTVKFSDREIPSGSINSSNKTFVLGNTPIADSEHVYLDGILQKGDTASGAPTASYDYYIDDDTITFFVAPNTGSRLEVSYRWL